MKILNQKELLKSIRTGIRLNTPAPRIEKDKSKYHRKRKHKKEDTHDN